MTPLLSSHFFVMALLAGGFASVAAGVIGSYVVIKRIAFIAGSISHAVLGGMGLFLFFRRTYDITWMTPIWGAIIAALLSSIIIGLIRLYYKEREDTVIAALWVLGMSIGVISISVTPGYNVELMNFLFGNILWASSQDILILAGLNGIILITVGIFYKQFVLICYDEKQARLQKIPVAPLYLLLLGLIGLTVVLLIQIVGAILVIAFLTLPAAASNIFSKSLPQMMILAVALGISITLIGLSISFTINWPPGATIALTSATSYMLALPLSSRKRKF